MKLPPPSSRRGQPLAALAVLMVGWVGVRTALWAGSLPEFDASPALPAPDKRAPGVAPQSPIRAEGAPAPVEPMPQTMPRTVPRPRFYPAEPAPPPVTTVPLDPATRPVTAVPAPAPAPSPAAAQVPPRIAAGHQLLFLAGVAALPMPEEALAAAAPPAPVSPPVPYLPAARTEALRWSADGWILWRQGGNGFNLPGAGLPGASLPSGAYGSSQAGLVLRYRIAPDSPHRPVLYVRATSGLYQPRGEELAAGLALRPLPRLPLAVMGEARVTRTTGGDVVRPAVAVVSEFPPVSLPLGLRGEGYGQAGWVGGKDHTPFIDGQARIDKPVLRAGKVELRVGAGAWGGAQRGASRIDVGPSATFDLPVGRVNTRLSADYRFRVAGDAAPGSGAAVTFSAGF